MPIQQIIAHCQAPLLSVRLAALWAELDDRLPQAQCIVHSAAARDYRLGGIDLRVRLATGTLSAVWAAPSALLNARTRVDLTQTAQAWVTSLAELDTEIATAYGCLDALSALLAAGFETVHLVRSGQLEAARAEAEEAAKAEANANQSRIVVGEVAFA